MRKIGVIYFLIFTIQLTLNGCAPSFDLDKPPTSENIEEYLDFIKNNAPDENAFVAVQRISEPYIQNHEWEKAALVFKKFKPYFAPMEKRFDKIDRLLLNKPDSTVSIKAVDIVNTENKEYMPSITSGANDLYFTRYSTDSGFGGEDIFISQIQNGKYVTAKNLSNEINTKKNESVLYVSPDGKKMLIFGHYTGSLGKGDIFYCDKTATGWGTIKHLPSPINSPYFDSDAFLTDNGKTIFFVSDRPGAIGSLEEKENLFHGSKWGNTDIYVSILEDTGWSNPINLGDKINTPFAERTPFLLPDDKTLYFSSEGHYGLGRLDIFKTTRLDDKSWTEWSEPENLGRIVNTTGDDWGYKISRSGDTAYFSSRSKEFVDNKDDIYELIIPNRKIKTKINVKGKMIDGSGNPIEVNINVNDLSNGETIAKLSSNPIDGQFSISLQTGLNYDLIIEKKGYFSCKKRIDLTINNLSSEDNINLDSIPIVKIVAKVVGKFIDGSGNPLEADVKWQDLSTTEILGQLRSNPLDGSFLITLPVGKLYGIYAEKKDYYSVSKDVDLRDKNDSVNIVLDFPPMVTTEEMIRKKLSTRINNIYFDFGKSELKEESFPELNRLSGFLKDNDSYRVEISAHTDNIGSDSYNIQLSRDRAGSVVQYLISIGCDKNKLISKGFGKTKPIESNDTEEGRAKNRRVEFKFVN